MCERFGKLPGEVLTEDITLMRWLTIESMGREEVYDGGE